MTNLYISTMSLILLRMRNVPDKIFQRNSTRFMFDNIFSENRALYEILWKNMVQSDRPQITIYYGDALCRLDN